MSKPIRSVLLLDYDSLYRSLAGAGGEAAARLASRIPGWLGGIEAGELVGPASVERTITVKRCYADPALLAQNGERFAAAGFTVIDCPATVSGTRAADINLAVDAIDALADDAEYDEFIVLSAEAALTPVLERLKEHERRVAVYADTTTTAPRRALADDVIEVAAFAEFLLTHDGDEAASAAALDRAEIEAFARKVHAATNIPLFSPKTFSELFRFLTAEIAANGYHFQTTAKNVADQLAETGRSVTRRQVVFVVKGLALKGHVFSTTDTPRKLAEVFREQAHYLIGSAGLALDDNQERLLSAWLVDRVPVTSAPPPSPRIAPAPRPTEAPTPPPVKPAAEAAPAARAAQPASQSKPTAQPTPPLQPPKPAAEVKPAAKAPAGKPSPVIARPPGEKKAPTPQKPAEAKPGKTMISPDDARAAIAARVAASVRAKVPPAARKAAEPPATEEPATPPVAQERAAPLVAEEPAAPPIEPSEQPEPVAGPPEQPADHALESSILAAIAEAVDVLVDTDAGDVAPAAARRTAPASAAARGKPRARPEPPAGSEPEEDGDDIGNEIQRIIATYNRTRKETPRT